jgi:hypothetical protein
VIDWHAALGRLEPGADCTCMYQHLSRAINKHDTFVHKGLHDFEQAVDVACVTHASLTRAMMCGDQIFVGAETLSRSKPKEVRNEEEASTGDN